MLSANNVKFSYSSRHDLLRDISVALEPGSFLAILGVNGCGKSTLMQLMVDILQPQGGAIELDGVPMHSVKRRDRAKNIAFVSQHSHANRLTVYDAILMGRHPHSDDSTTEEDRKVVNDVMGKLGLKGYSLRYMDELSGGEYQKVVLARAFVQQTPILLLDEPTNNLDPANCHEVMQAVRDEVDQRSVSAAAVMHDINLSLGYCDRFMFVKDGVVESLGGPETITPERIKKIYGLEADVIEHKGQRVVIARKATSCNRRNLEDKEKQ